MIKICIPSFNRWYTIKENTINLVKDLWFELYVFVEDENNFNNYSKELEWLNIKIIQTNTKKIAPKRNFILNYFKEWDKIVMLDDDIKWMYYWVKWKELIKMSEDQIKKFIELWFLYCEKNLIKLFWVYPIKNNFFMNKSIKNDWFIIWQFMWIIINNLRFDEIINSKEDYDFTLQNIKKFWAVARYQMICLQAMWKKNNNKWWCNEYRNDKTESEDFLYMKDKWWDYIRENTKRKNEIIINKIIK